MAALKTMEKWPNLYLGSRINTDIKKAEICKLANKVRSTTAHGLEEKIDIDSIAKLGRFRPVYSRYLKNSTIWALLIGLDNDAFQIALQPNKTEEAGQIRRYLMAHEIAHSFGYVRRQGERPRRFFNGPNIFWEERFCEEFARQLLVPREAIPNFKNAEEISRHFDVTRQLARLAISAKPMVKQTSNGYEYVMDLS